MGLIKNFLILTTPFCGYAIYSAVKIGSKLPNHCYQTGRDIGKFYLSLKYLFNEYRPEIKN